MLCDGTRYTALMSDASLDHKVCGMHRNLAIAVRDAGPTGTTRLQEIEQALINRLRDVVHHPLVVSVSIGTLFRDWHGSKTDSSHPLDVHIQLISDPLNVESKMMTFVRRGLPGPVSESVYSCLYKYDPTS
ncbi:hypothetical protein Pelo_6679 [Pelomyxa schiedti]|nr:hypothetical protein Pelo_6679 [Pelomyxa schiedti]